MPDLITIVSDYLFNNYDGFSDIFIAHFPILERTFSDFVSNCGNYNNVYSALCDRITEFCTILRGFEVLKPVYTHFHIRPALLLRYLKQIVTIHHDYQKLLARLSIEELGKVKLLCSEDEVRDEIYAAYLLEEALNRLQIIKPTATSN